MCTERGDIAPRALEEFDASLRHLSPSTKRLYLAGAKALLRAVFAAPAGPPAVAPYEELSARARDVKLPEGVRTRPFLRFLESRQAPALPEGSP